MKSLDMSPKQALSFDSKSFLTREGEGRTLAHYRKDELIFLQGDWADSVFYIHSGKVKLAVNSEKGKEAIIAILEPGITLARVAWQDEKSACLPPPHCPTAQSCGWRKLWWSTCSMKGRRSPRPSSPFCSPATFGLRRTWLTSSLTPVKNGWRGCF